MTIHDESRRGGSSRRQFLGTAVGASAAWMGMSLTHAPWLRAAGANSDIRIGVVGVGSTIKVGGMGRKEVATFRKVPGFRVVALCDVDSANLGREADACAKRGEKVETYRDVRKLLESKDIDAVVVTTPNHWHALVTIWACQAGKDVWVQKPACHNIFEGRKMVEAARKYNRIVQCPNGSRGQNGFQTAVKYVHEGRLGKITKIRHVHFGPRTSIGKVSGPQPIPATVDYDLWSGPAPVAPLMRTNLHYDWHWQWPYGDGELGNWGIHNLDGCRMFLNAGAPKHVVSIAGRFGYDDDGQTPNSQIIFFDYDQAPLLTELHSLPKNRSFLKNAKPNVDNWGPNAMDEYLGISVGKVIHCEQGYVVSTPKNHMAFDQDGKKLQDFKPTEPELHENFREAMRSRRREDQIADIEDGHLSATLIHLGNISHRIGKTMPPGEIRERVAGNKELTAVLERLLTHLAANGIDVEKSPLTMGAMLTYDPQAERFNGEFSAEANPLLTREYRAPFVVPAQV